MATIPKYKIGDLVCWDGRNLGVIVNVDSQQYPDFVYYDIRWIEGNDLTKGYPEEQVDMFARELICAISASIK